MLLLTFSFFALRNVFYRIVISHFPTTRLRSWLQVITRKQEHVDKIGTEIHTRAKIHLSAPRLENKCIGKTKIPRNAVSCLPVLCHKKRVYPERLSELNLMQLSKICIQLASTRCKHVPSFITLALIALVK